MLNLGENVYWVEIYTTGKKKIMHTDVFQRSVF
jgi:hypothetical protein